MNRCDSCLGTEFETQKYPQTKPLPLDFKFIQVCKSCGLGKVLSAITDADLEKFYEKGEYWENVTISKVLNFHYQAQCSERIRKIKPYLENAKTIKVLDIGAGSGFILDELMKIPNTSIYYSFIEPDSTLANGILSKKTKQNICHKIQDLKSANENEYDLIFLNQVLEHVLEPMPFLTRISSLLKKSGLLYIEVPNFDCAYKEDVFPHTLFFTPPSLKKIIEKSSFDVRASSAFGYPSTQKWGILEKVLIRLQLLAIRFNCSSLVLLIDRIIFKYRKLDENGAWIYTICTKKNES